MLRKLRRAAERLSGAEPDPRELGAVAIAAFISLALVIAYVLARRPIGLVGDMIEYDLEGRFFADGKLWWSTSPFGVAHATSWKAPIYPAWVGVLYETLGSSPARVAAVQSLLAPITVALTWGLARRLFDRSTAIASAFLVATFPMVWEWFGLLYAEALAIPLTLVVLVLMLTGTPSRGRAIGIGIALGLSLLLRPTSMFLFAGLAVAWVLACGPRRGIGLTALATLVAALIVAPWTIRNFVVSDGFVPISVQDAAVYGTFNEESASDPEYPYAWRAFLEDQPDVLEGEPVSDSRLRSELQAVAFDYIRENPESVPKAFFWNGLTRFWDVRKPANAIGEVPSEGRSKGVSIAGLVMYYALLPLAIFGLWRIRGRPLLLPLLAIAITASVVFTVVSGTRYRAPLEPVIVILAASVVVSALRRDRNGPPDSQIAAR